MGNTISLKFTRASPHRKKRKEKPNALEKKWTEDGLCECQVLESGRESEESAAAWQHCTKNPGHESFISVDELAMTHLPVQCQRMPVLEYVKNVAVRTVRIRASYTSKNRPDHSVFSKVRGLHILRCGSGWLSGVSPVNGTCPCSECTHSTSPQLRWYEICIETSCHVVYDSEEANFTKVDLFYDDEAALRDGRMKTLEGLELTHKDEDGDWSRLRCATHDVSLAGLLQKYVEQGEDKWDALKDDRPRGGWRYLCVVVSHPHGKAKRITVGRMESWKKVRRHQRTFTYSTDTCAGSSGAPVLALDYIGMINDVLWVSGQTWMAPHKGSSEDRKFNESGTTLAAWTDLNTTCWRETPKTIDLSEYNVDTSKV